MRARLTCSTRGRWSNRLRTVSGYGVDPSSSFVYLNEASALRNPHRQRAMRMARPTLYRTYRFRLYCASHINDKRAGQPAYRMCFRLAHGLPTLRARSHDYTELTPLIQPPAVDLTQTATFSIGQALGGGNGVKIQVNITGPIYTDISNNLNIAISSDFVVSGGQLTQNLFYLANSVNFDTTNFIKTGGVLLINAVAVNQLIAGNALFLGTATFAYSGGGKLTLNSSGLTIADNNLTPTATVTLSSIGATVAKGSNSVQITATGVSVIGGSGSVSVFSTGVQMLNGSNSAVLTSASITLTGPSGNLVMNSSGLTVTNGSNSLLISSTHITLTGSGGSSIDITSSLVTITNGKISCTTSGGVTVSIDPGNVNPLQVTHGSDNTKVDAGSVQLHSASAGTSGLLTSQSLSLGDSATGFFCALGAQGFSDIVAGGTIQTPFTGTLAAAIAGGKNVQGGIIY